MRATAEAARLVRRARLRMTLVGLLAGGTRGLLVGAFLGLVCAAALPRPTGRASWPLLLPLGGALIAGSWTLRRRPGMAGAALGLDAAAGTREAFLSALTATDARPAFRELAARYALDLCPPLRLREVLPVRPPRLAPAAVVAGALLAVVVLVPRGPVDGGSPPPAGGPAAVGVTLQPSAQSGSPVTSPQDRVDALAAALRAAPDEVPGAGAQAGNGPDARGDLAAVPDASLRRLAEALADTGDEDGGDENGGDEAAARAAEALAALDAGDREAALAALSAALGGGAAAGLPEAPGQGARAPAPWSAPAWPLRYDRLVRNWFNDSSGGGGDGGVR